MPSTETSTPKAAEGEQPGLFRFRDAYQKTAPERAALDPGDFSSIGLDLALAINTVLAANPRIQELHDELAELPIDHEQIAQLETYAQAAGHALALYNVATAPPERLDEVYQEAVERRNTLKSDALNLATHNLVNKDAVAALKGDVGYRNVGYDLMSLVSLLRASATRIAGRSATLPEDLDKAEAIANELLELAALREARSSIDPKVSENRHRAFTLMQKAYDQARRAVSFLRWDRGDADKITPALYGSKGSRRREDPAAEQPTVPVTPTTQGTTPSATTPVAPAVPGGQGGSPFV
ncbi:MAG TPA: hypothetical protein VHM70_28785 [Polyangiaceae bacterium]|nr:hypothetical protein [Polyangiaceae bacterium]